MDDENEATGPSADCSMCLAAGLAGGEAATEEEQISAMLACVVAPAAGDCTSADFVEVQRAQAANEEPSPSTACEFLLIAH